MRTSVRRLIRVVAPLTAACLLALGFAELAMPAGATPAMPVPTQADCDSGSVTPIWPNTGIAVRPMITAISVDGETIAPSRIEGPSDGELGAAICAQDPNFAKNSGLTFYRRTGSSTTADISGAVTPLGHTVTAASEITVTVAFGDLSPYWSFATVFGTVRSWSTSGLRSSAASLTATFSAADGVWVNDPGCTQQPPNCDPPKADIDTFGLSMQFKAERGPDTGFNAFAGGYFSLQSAVGGFVAARDGGLEVTIAGPHFKSDGTTLNIGSMSAFVPESFLQQAFGLAAAGVTSSTFAVTRTEGGTTAPAAWSYRVVTGGIAVDVPSIGFSSPKYRIAKSGGSTATTPSAPKAATWPAPPFFHTTKSGRTVTAGFAAAPGGRYVVTYTNLFRTYHVTVTSTSKAWKGRWIRKTLGRGPWLVITRQVVPGGYSDPAFGLVRV